MKVIYAVFCFFAIGSSGAMAAQIFKCDLMNGDEILFSQIVNAESAQQASFKAAVINLEIKDGELKTQGIMPKRNGDQLPGRIGQQETVTEIFCQ